MQLITLKARNTDKMRYKKTLGCRRKIRDTVFGTINLKCKHNNECNELSTSG